MRGLGATAMPPADWSRSTASDESSVYTSGHRNRRIPQCLIRQTDAKERTFVLRCGPKTNLQVGLPISR
jgi:hypothetical protein